MKRLIVCCDGTWQSTSNEIPTNVLKIAQAIKSKGKDQVDQVLYYDEGIGAIPLTDEKQPFLQEVEEFIEKVGGGGFGWGIDEKIQEAYIFLCLNYNQGDEIYLFGFSRGAYTVRSLVGLIACCGLLQRPYIDKTSKAYELYRIRDDEKREQKSSEFRKTYENEIQEVPIKFLGCWDTVGALGIPNWIDWFDFDRFINARYKFHSNQLSSIIENARHAIAIDEKRKAFDITIMTPSEDFKGTLEQVWFPGDHGCVGGGTKEFLGLSNAALKWMADEASNCGLDVDLHLAKDTKILDATVPFNSKSMLGIKGEHKRDISKLNKTLLDISDKFKFKLHPSVKERWERINYCPNNLKTFVGDSLNW